LILLHRPFALYEKSKVDADGDSDVTLNGLFTIFKAVCVENAFKMVLILTQQCQRFDPTRTPQGQLQHIGTAVTALISAVAVSQECHERAKMLDCLHTLAGLARAISLTYTPAEMITNVLDNLLKEPGWGPTTHAVDTVQSQAGPVMYAEYFNNSEASKQGFGMDHSLHHQNDEFDLMFEACDTRDMLSSLENARRGTTGGVAPGLICSSLPTSDQMHAQATTNLKSWCFPDADVDGGLLSFDIDRFHLPEGNLHDGPLRTTYAW